MEIEKKLLPRARSLLDAMRLEEALVVVDALRGGGYDSKEVKGFEIQLKADITRRVNAFMTPLRAGRLYAAASAKGQVIPGLPGYEIDGKEIRAWASGLDRDLEKINAGLRRAKLGDDPDAAFLEYEAILAVCSDCREALEGIRHCAPQPPKDLTVRYSMSEKKVALNWGKSASPGPVEYIVCRREGRLPDSPSDGRQESESSGLLFSDNVENEVGRVLFYAVYAIRKGVVSKTGLRSEAIPVIAEVSGARAESGEGRVVIDWQPPIRFKRVMVTRKDNSSPREMDDGVNIPCTSKRMEDTDVTNGVHYYYRITVAYDGGGGRSIVTEGVVCDATPDQFPRPVEKIEFKKVSRGIEISWDPPEIGQVVVFERRAPGADGYGTRIQVADLDRLGTALVGGRRSVERDDLETGIYYFTAVSIQSDWACVGQCREYAHIPDVSGVRAENLGEKIRLTWNWPEGCELAKVVWKTGGPPRNHLEAGEDSELVSRGGYHKQGGFFMKAARDREYYFLVSSALARDGGHCFSPSVGEDVRSFASTRRKGKITYALKKIKKMLFRLVCYALVITCEGATDLPEIVFRAQGGYLPVTVDDGVEIARVDKNTVLSDGSVSIEIALDTLPPDGLIKAFFTNDEDYDRFSLEAVSRDAICVSD